jgi:hypothetical protein
MVRPYSSHRSLQRRQKQALIKPRKSELFVLSQLMLKEGKTMYHNLFRITLLVTAVAVILTACVAPATEQPIATLAPATEAVPTATEIVSTSMPAPTAVLGVTSTLEGSTTLHHRIQWVAIPSISQGQVSEVDFLIDNQIAYVERRAPYSYGGDGNYLVTSFLTPGEHSFTVRMITVGGQRADSSVKAMVAAAPAPPDGLANTSWTREMTASDRQKATSSQPPPSGSWDLTIDSVGWMIHDPEEGGLLLDVAYESAGGVELRPTIARPPFPNPINGFFCTEPDPSVLWTYTISDGGNTLTLHPVSEDPCGDRVAILEGTWTRKGN